jgi:hypothetical protein
VEPSVDPLAELDFEVREPGWWVKPVLARLSLLAVVVAALVLLWDEHAEAHSGVGLTVSSDGRGAIRVAAQWRDGHPVTDALGATMTATSDGGQRVGPLALRPAGQGTGVVTYAGPLPAGGWSVVIDVGTPAIARCEAKLTVAGPGGAAPVPTSVLCPAAAEDSGAAGAGVDAGAARGARNAAETATAGSSRSTLVVTVVAIIVVGALLLALARRQRIARAARTAGAPRAARTAGAPRAARTADGSGAGRRPASHPTARASQPRG